MREGVRKPGCCFSIFHEEIHQKNTHLSIVHSGFPRLRLNCSNKILVLATIICMKCCPHTGLSELNWSLLNWRCNSCLVDHN